MKLKWLGQSGYQLKSTNSEILIDPYLSDIVYKREGKERMVKAPLKPQDITAKAVVCTHNHIDHLDLDAVVEMPKDTHFITTDEGKNQLLKLGIKSVTSLKIGEQIVVGDFIVKAVFAKHTCEAFGVVISCENKRYYFSGDTLFDKNLFDIAVEKPNVSFICINGKLGNMNVDEAITVANKIGAEINIPNHYGMFISNTEKPEKFTSKVKGGKILQFNKEYTF